MYRLISVVILVLVAMVMNGCALDDLVDPLEIKLDDTNQRLDDIGRSLEDGIPVTIDGYSKG